MSNPAVDPNNLNWLESLFHGLTRFSQTVNTGVSGAFGSLAALFDLYGFYKIARDEEVVPQRKTKLATYLASFILNSLYTTGVVLKFLSTLALSFIWVGVDFLALARISYITHQARKAVAKTKQELKNLVDAHEPAAENARFQRAEFGSLSTRLELQREHRFKCKVEVGYSIVSTITSCLFVGGLLFPPLLMIGVGLFIAAKTVQLIDARMDYAISRWLGNLWSRVTAPKKIKHHEPVVEDSEILLTHSKDIRPVPVIVAADKNVPVINTTYARQKNKMLASHTRFFCQTTRSNTKVVSHDKAAVINHVLPRQ